MLEISPITAFNDNYIWLWRQGRRAAVVDPGDAAPVLARLAEEGLTLEAILVTHHHADHQGGVVPLLEALGTSSIQVFGPGDESITGCTHPLRGGEQLTVLGESVEVLAVPGHTRAHLAYRIPGAVFCGDTLFGAGCGRLFEGTPVQMAASLATLAALPDDTLIYCAHEYTAANLRFAQTVEPDNPAIAARVAAVARRREDGEPTVPSTLAEEKATNPFLRCREPAVAAAALGGHGAGEDPVRIFAALRQWRNEF